MKGWGRSVATGSLVIAAAVTAVTLWGGGDSGESGTTVLSADQAAGASAGADSSPTESSSSDTTSDPSTNPGATDRAATSSRGRTAEAVPVPMPAPTSAPDEVGADATDLVLPFMEASSASRATPTKPVNLQDVATGAAHEDLEVEAFEFAENGMVQAGKPKIVMATIDSVDISTDPPERVVLVCLDYSDVDIQTPDGVSLKDPDAPERVPVVLTMQHIAGRWLVAERSFPDEATC